MEIQGRTGTAQAQEILDDWPGAGYEAGMAHFFHILSLPDNIPIVLMMVSVILLTWLSFSEAKKNDKLTEEGKADQIYRRMVE